jgi:hypothetical protein
MLAFSKLVGHKLVRVRGQYAYLRDKKNVWHKYDLGWPAPVEFKWRGRWYELQDGVYVPWKNPLQPPSAKQRIKEQKRTGAEYDKMKIKALEKQVRDLKESNSEDTGRDFEYEGAVRADAQKGHYMRMILGQLQDAVLSGAPATTFQRHWFVDPYSLVPVSQAKVRAAARRIEMSRCFL